MEDFVKNLPKAELHIHLDGTMEPELWKKLAERNGLEFPFKDVEDARKAFEFKGLEPFIVMYDKCVQVILNADDLYDVTFDYLK